MSTVVKQSNRSEKIINMTHKTFKTRHSKLDNTHLYRMNKYHIKIKIHPVGVYKFSAYKASKDTTTKIR